MTRKTTVYKCLHVINIYHENTHLAKTKTFPVQEDNSFE